MRAFLVVALFALAGAHAAVAPAAAQPAPDIDGAPWSHGPMCQDPATTEGLPKGQCRHMRILLQVDVPDEMLGMANLPVTTAVDLAEALGGLGEYPSFPNGQLYGFELDLGALILIEVSAGDWAPVRLDTAGQAVPEAMLAFPGDLNSAKAFDARTNPTVTLQWVLAGPTDGARHFLLYFDSLHHGKKTPVQHPASQLGRVASAIGPGRGNTVYVSLHGELGVATATDPRTLRVTNLQASPATIDVYEYERFNLPKPEPRQGLRDLPLGGGVGTTITIQLPTDYDLDAVKVVSKGAFGAAGGLVLVEAVSRVGSSMFQPGNSRLFLPSVDGGYVGSTFAGQSPGATNWLVFCPSIPENTAPCQVSGSAGAATIPVGSGFATLPVGAGLAASLHATTGLVMVERTPAGSPGREQLGLTLWPPADGPITSSLFYGQTSSQPGVQDKLMVVSHTTGSRLQVFNLQTHTFLSDNLDPKGPGLFSEGVGGAWGTSWKRDWQRDTGERVTHEDGPIRIRDQQARGLTVGNGVVYDDAGFSAFVPALTPDGGLTYRVTIPTDSSGNALGRIALFSPFAGTDVKADRTSGGPATQVGVDALQKDDYVQSFINQAGTWLVTANHPVLLTWVKVGAEPMAGFAPALTLGLNAEVAAAQFAGYAFELEGNVFKTVVPGGLATFEITVNNRARRIDGTPLHDAALLAATVPQGWPDADIKPSTVVLPPGESRTAKVEAAVPLDVDVSEGGATVLLHSASSGESGYRIDLPLRINYQVERRVDVTADGKDTTSERAVTAEETATFIVRVTNLGSVNDTFRLEYALPAAPWSVEVECPDLDTCFEGGEHTTPPMAKGDTLEYHFHTRTTSKTASRLTTAVLATSLADPSVADAVRLLTVLDAERKMSVIIEETSQVVLPGEAANFTITFKNDGEQDEEVRLGLNATGPASWGMPGVLVDDPDFDAPVPLANLNNTFGVRLQQSVRLLVRQQVPAAAPPGQIMVMRLSVGTGQSDTQARSEHQLRVISGRSSGLNVTGLPDAVDLLAGTSVDIPFTLTSTSNAVQMVRLHATVQPLPREWNVTLDGKPGPWTLNLTAGGSASAKLSVLASRNAPATSFVPSTLLLQMAVPGASIVPAQVKLRVPDALDVTLVEGKLRLEAGRSQEILLHLRNAGNVPVQATGSFEGVDWPARWGNASVAPGEDGTLRVWLDVPTGASGRTVTLRLVDRASGTVLGSPTLTLEVRTPQLDIRVTAVRELANGLRSYTLAVTNNAPGPARMVQIQLLQGERVLDAAVLESILPGASGTAHLVSSAPDGLSLRVRSTDDPSGRVVPLDATGIATGEASRPAPAPAALLILALAAIALARRRSQA